MKVKKKFKIYSVLLIVVLILGFDLLYANDYLKTFKKHEAVSIIPQPSFSPVPKAANEWSAPVFSPDRNLYARFRIEPQSDKIYQLNLIVVDFRLDSKVPGSDIKSESIDENQEIDYKSYPQKYISWSSNTSKLAVLMPSQVITIFDYAVEPVSDPLLQSQGDELKITKTQTVNIKNESGDSSHIFFSGDGSELYFESTFGIIIISPVHQVFSTSSEYRPPDSYPIRNSRGVAYWGKRSRNNRDNHNYEIILDYGGTYRKYPIHFDFAADYVQDIDFSPDLNKACVGWRSSGSGGSLVFDLFTGKMIKNTQNCLT